MESENPFRDSMGCYFTDTQLDRVRGITVGIAGAGGLGSNVAMILARSGIENFRIIDRDVVEPSNLNRQHYWPRHIGQPKVGALAHSLMELNGAIQLDLRRCAFGEDNASDLLAGVPIWVEAFDAGAGKALFVEKALLEGLFVVAASGLCGIGGPVMCKREIGNLVVVGDFVTGLEQAPPYAPRVVQAAAMMADCVLEKVLAG